MSLWDYLKNWWDRDRQHLTVQWIDADAAQPPMPTVSAVADVHYFRVKLSEMFLGKQVTWFQGVYPAVQSLIQCQFGNTPVVEIPYVADSSKLGIAAQEGQGDILARNFILVPTMPFKGGTVAVNLGLVALNGENYLNRFLKTLGTFANLLAAPQISSALEVAGPLASGIQDLFGQGNGRLHLGFRDTFHAPNFKNGYVAVVRATPNQVPPTSLRVIQGELHQSIGPKPTDVRRLVDYDFMLLQFEVLADRDDWAGLTAIDVPFREAVKLLEIPSQAKAAAVTLQKAILAALQAGELTEAHRKPVIEEIKRRFAYRREILTANQLETMQEPLSLATIMKTVPPPTKAPAKPLSLAEALADLPA